MFKRRNFLQYGAALGAAPLLGSRGSLAATGADYDVVIIGAGMAGMTAARILSKAGPGLKVIILEARDRVGGRLYTAPDEDKTLPPHGLEMGAQFIHGSEAASWELIREYGIQTSNVRSFGEPVYHYFSPGEGSWDPDWETMEAQKALLQQAWDAYDGPDLSCADAINALGLNAQQAQILANESQSWSAEPSRSSAKATLLDGAKWDAYKDADFKVMGGYSTVANRMAADLAGKIQLSSEVTDIFWSAGLAGVTYKYAGGKTSLTARRIIVTLPVGILQSDALRIEPSLPEWKQEAIDSLEMGQVVVAKLFFSDPLWREQVPGAGGWTTPDGRVSFNLPHPPNELGRAVNGWFSGSAARQLSELGEEAAMRQILAWLGEASGVQGLGSRLKWYRYKDWVSDPYSRGSYSFTRPGGHGQHYMLAKPVANTLFFAGEATASPPHYQTVHGAYMSGKRAAKEVADSLQTGVSQEITEDVPVILETDEDLFTPL
jgi:monoamine oxidase